MSTGISVFVGNILVLYRRRVGIGVSMFVLLISLNIRLVIVSHWLDSAEPEMVTCVGSLILYPLVYVPGIVFLSRQNNRVFPTDTLKLNLRNKKGNLLNCIERYREKNHIITKSFPKVKHYHQNCSILLSSFTLSPYFSFILKYFYILY